MFFFRYELSHLNLHCLPRSLNAIGIERERNIELKTRFSFKGVETNGLINSLIKVLEQHSMISETFWKLSYSETRESLRYNITGANYLFTDEKEK